ncbi:hypothetical protein [Bosea sp. ASV33]|uniref:hypothetical protein n=1 Tax=Bosea sp. ASV33 TaxID=2795106 RepID=UPI0018EB83BD|nr:hypothetical protein [Bosea sp. ASV33]
MQATRYRLGSHDRIKIAGAAYRPVQKIGREHLLQLVTEGVLQQHFRLVSDEEIGDLLRNRRVRIEENHYSLARQFLLAKGDDSNLHGLEEDEIRSIAWKAEWCRRFEEAQAGGRFSRSMRDFESFIEQAKDSIHRWYIEEFRAARPLGRDLSGEERKTFDYPSASTLRYWLNRYAAADRRRAAFRPRYENCGNKDQLDPRVAIIVEKNVNRYASRARPRIADIYEAVEADIDELNHSLPEGPKVYVSERAIRRRIRRLPPLFVDLGHLGPDRTKKKYSPVGSGLGELARMERVEMDDWEMDLQAVLRHKHARYFVTEQARSAANKLRRLKITVRCTITAAIDVGTKCIVGLAVSPFAPSTAGSKSALRSIIVDKSELAKAAGAASDWPMTARPRAIVTDGGPAFRGEFSESVSKLNIEHSLPGGNPRNRGTIESFFRTFKRFCRQFTGQAFSNVVEKGDYPSEQMASLVVEDLERLLTRFIVDSYHHRPHRGLGGDRPYNAWAHSTADLDVPPDHIQRLIAFGVELHDRAISATGIRYFHVDYKHSRMAALFGLAAKERLTAIVDPHDMGTMLVLVKDEFRDHFTDDRHGNYLIFTAEGYEGTSVAEHFRSNRVLREFEREQAALGAPFRLGALRAIRQEAEAARIRAGIPSDEVDAKAFRNFVRYLERKGAIAVEPRRQPSGEPMNMDDGLTSVGTLIAGSEPPPKVKTTGTQQSPGSPSILPRSINLYDDESDE